jgi:hypothetical protein
MKEIKWGSWTLSPDGTLKANGSGESRRATKLEVALLGDIDRLRTEKSEIEQRLKQVSEYANSLWELAKEQKRVLDMAKDSLDTLRKLREVEKGMINLKDIELPPWIQIGKERR